MPLLARSNEEAHLYLDLHSCECGGEDAARNSAVSLDGDQWIVRYTCVCAGCGRSREVAFRQPESPARPAAGGWAAGDEPSELIDAGEWLWVSDMFAGTPADVDGLSPEEAAQAREDLTAAGAALDEVVKFLPGGAEEVPATAFWTERGRQLRQAEPGRFRRERLAAVRDRYHALLAERQ
ncbi:hypothetical protein [Dactylosporangium sp. NPDC048998]|uniref:hypothetical protein n=1 Tax=Dactylosporangium sp. NPDC048998 TaxID=3363976 RepID=UPI00371B4CB4